MWLLERELNILQYTQLCGKQLMLQHNQIAQTCTT